MRPLVLSVWWLGTACTSYKYSSETGTAPVVPILDGTKLLVGEQFSRNRLDTDDPDANPETLEQYDTLYQMTPTGEVIWKTVIEDVREIRWAGRLADRNIMIGQGTQHWLARAYDDTGKQVWQTTLPDDAIARPLRYGLLGPLHLDATALVEGDHIRIVRLQGDTLRLDAVGHLSSEPAPWPPADLSVDPSAFHAIIWPLDDGGTAVVGRRAGSPADNDILIARYSADGVLRWTTTLTFFIRAVSLRNDDTLAVTGFASNVYDASAPRYLVFDSTGQRIVDADLSTATVQVTECMAPDGPDGMILHGPAASRDPSAFHIRTLRLDGGGAVVADIDSPLPPWSSYTFDAACRVGYANVLHATADVGLLDPLGAPVH